METSQIVTIKNENKLPMPSITIVPETGILVNYPVQFIANGEDEKEAFEALKELISAHFYENE